MTLSNAITLIIVVLFLFMIYGALSSTILNKDNQKVERRRRRVNSRIPSRKKNFGDQIDTSGNDNNDGFSFSGGDSDSGGSD